MSSNNDNFPECQVKNQTDGSKHEDLQSETETSLTNKPKPSLGFFFLAYELKSDHSEKHGI